MALKHWIKVGRTVLTGVFFCWSLSVLTAISHVDLLEKPCSMPTLDFVTPRASMAPATAAAATIAPAAAAAAATAATAASASAATASAATTSSNDPYCNFRRYPPHRYYGLANPDPYYREVEYVYGQWPVVLPLSKRQTKICLHRDDLGPVVDGQLNATLAWPLTDGSNPSILHISGRVHDEAPEVAKLFQQVAPQAHYLVSITVKMANPYSMCFWRDDDTPRRKWPSSSFGFDVPNPQTTKEDDRRVELQLLDQHFHLLSKTTIAFVDDSVTPSQPDGLFYDDPRLFIHNGAIHIAYIAGDNILNLQLVQFASNDNWSATAKSSDIIPVCCGRNMGFFPNWYGIRAFSKGGTAPSLTHPDLYAIAWVDPLSIIKINTTTKGQQRQSSQRRRLLQHPMDQRRRLQVVDDFPSSTGNYEPEGPSSGIHGTNGFMVPFVETNQLLGIAHFHREQPGVPSTFARWGHHYTHAFYTMSLIENKTTAADPTGDDRRYFGLTGLSAEFVFPSAHVANDGDGIQFASGLEFNPLTKEIIIGYGINDCESALIVVDLPTVLDMLRPISTRGQRVLDFMKKVDF